MEVSKFPVTYILQVAREGQTDVATFRVVHPKPSDVLWLTMEGQNSPASVLYLIGLRSILVFET